MRLLGGLLLLALGCGSSPGTSFDAGHDVHVILLLKPAPKQGVMIRPVATLGPEVVKSPPRLLKEDEAPAVEVAVFRAPRGRHRLSVWEPGLMVGARADLDVKAEAWIVMEMRPGEPKGRLRIYDRPPNKAAPRYVPLVPVPD
jgi:hypothetical protein